VLVIGVRTIIDCLSLYFLLLTGSMVGIGLKTFLFTVALSDTHRHCSSNHLRISQLWFLAHTHYRT
jgi:hypothetical protein